MTGAEDEGALLARFRAGDREAFTRIYRGYSPTVFRFVVRMSGDAATAAEITQDVFVWLIHHPDHFDPDRGGLGALLTGVSRRMLIRRWQKQRRWVPLQESVLPASFSPGPDEIRGDDRVERLRELIAALPTRYREVVVLCDLEGHTYEAAAGILDCAVGTVRSRLHRARVLLARKFGAEKDKGLREEQECGV